MQKERLVELDILRGLSILGMILVITPGDWSLRFAWMNHAEWRGYPLSDMIFPTFLFCVGMAMAISFHKQTTPPTRKLAQLARVGKRVLLLILMGLLINGFPFYDLSNLRIPGVLQRIALCYGIVAVWWLFLVSPRSPREITKLIVSMGVILFFYYLLLYHIPVPGLGITGTSSANSWPAYVDQKVFGIHHLWPHGLTEGEVTYDPEGLIAALPASVNVFFGLIIGLLFVRQDKRYNPTFLMLLGAGLALLGFLLDYWEIMPMVKKIWTSSFAVFSSGVSILILGFLRFLIQRVPKTKGLFHPFMVYGSNAILAFAISNMLIPIFELSVQGQSLRKTGFDFFYGIIPNGPWASFTFSLVFLILLFGVLQILYSKRIFLKV
ncbi:MAG: heparan-alpha-glucosaminide N-acetyltransferase domain-containing protein [Bacteroidota bacterium]